MSVDDLVARLRAEGTVAAEGGFSLDREKAREKLRQFQLADPHRWVLLVVQALVERGATTIDIEIDADDVRMHADGAPLGTGEFEDLYSSIFDTSQRQPGLRELAMATNAAMALNPRYARIDSGDGRQAVRIELRPGTDDRIAPLVPPVVGTHVHVKERFRPGLFVRFLKRRDGVLPEQVLLRERCRFADTVIRLEGEVLSGQRATLLPGAVELVVGPLAGWAALEAGGNPGRLAILRHGVWISGTELPPTLVGLQAVLEASALRTDASMSDVVRDATFDAWMAGLAALYDRMLGEMYDEHVARSVAPPPWLVLALRSRLASRLRLAHELPTTPMLAKWCTYPLWTRVDGRAVALATIFDPRRSVAICTEAPVTAVPSDFADILLVDTKEVRAALDEIFGKRIVDRTGAVKQAMRREANRAAWRGRPHAPRLPDERSYSVRTALSGKDLEGEIGLARDPSQQSFLRVVVDGCMLVELAMTTPLPGVHAVVQAPVVANAKIDGVLHDARFAAVALAVAAGIGSLARALAESVAQTDPIPAPTGQLLADAMHGLVTPAADIALLQSLGFSAKAARDHIESGERTWKLGPVTARSTDPLVRARVFLDEAERPISLIDIAAAHEQDGHVRVIALKRPVLRNAAQLFVRAGERKLELLQALFGEPSVLLGGEEFERCIGREAFQRHTSPQPVTIDRPCRRGPVTFVDGVRRGVVGLLDAIDGSPLAEVQVFVDQRPISRREIQCGVPAVAIAVEVEPELARPDFQELVAAVEPRLAATVAAAVQALVGALAQPADDGPMLRPALVAVARLVWPAPAMLRAWDALRKELGEDAGDQAYAELLAALDRHRPAEVFADVQERLDQSVVPIPQLVVPALQSMPEGEPWAALRTAALQHAEALLQIPCLMRGGAAPVGLVRVMEALRSGVPVRWVLEGTSVPPTEDVLVLDARTASQLATIVGAEAIVDATAEVVLAGRKQTFEQRAALTQLAVSRDECIVAFAVDVASTTGELAIPPHRPGEAIGAVVVCHRRRPLGTIDPGDGLPWTGVIDGAFGHDTGYEELSAGDRSRVRNLVTGQYAAAVRAIAEAWPRLGEPAIGIARAWALRLLGSIAAQTGGAPLALAERGIAAIGLVPLFTDLAGNERTLDQLHVDWREHGDLVYASQPGAQVERLVIAIEDEQELVALRAIFGEVRDWSVVLARRAEIEARRRSLPVMPTVPDDALVSVEFADRGLVGWLWLTADVTDESSVAFGRDGRVVGQYRVSSMFPCAGAVTGPGLEIDADWAMFELSTAQQNKLKNEACTLYELLLAKAKPPIAEPIARPLRNLMLRLHAIPTARRKWPSHDQRKMYRELRQLPLLPLTTGKAISLAVALRERPASLERLGLWDPRERAVDDVPHVEPVKEPRPATSTPPAAKPPAPVAAPPPSDPAPALAGPPPALRRPSPFDPVLRLLEAVRAELGFVRRAEHALLANIRLERMTVHELTGDAVVHWIDGLLVVDASHAVVKRALAEPERPLFASIIASAVYTTLNCALQEVTDAHELVFLRCHAAHVRTGVRDRSKL